MHLQDPVVGAHRPADARSLLGALHLPLTAQVRVATRHSLCLDSSFPFKEILASRRQCTNLEPLPAGTDPRSSQLKWLLARVIVKQVIILLCRVRLRGNDCYRNELVLLDVELLSLLSSGMSLNVCGMSVECLLW